MVQFRRQKNHIQENTSVVFHCHYTNKLSIVCPRRLDMPQKQLALLLMGLVQKKKEANYIFVITSSPH